MKFKIYLVKMTALKDFQLEKQDHRDICITEHFSATPDNSISFKDVSPNKCTATAQDIISNQK
jgi:hypothetical protein